MPTVLHVSDSEEFGGTERAILGLIDGLDRARWRCVLMHCQPAGSPLIDGLRRLGVADVPVAPAHGLRGLARVPGALRWIRAERPALVHAHLTYPLACTSTLLAAALARVPAIVATAHLFMPLPSTRRARAQHRMLAATIARYIAVSNHVARSFHDHLQVPEQKITVVHNAVPVSPFLEAVDGGLRVELTGGADVPVVLTVARLERQKGHALLLEAATHVPQAVFVFAGDGPERARLEESARALGLHGRVRFLGQRRDVPRLLAACDMLVLPSLYEGHPIAALEAMAAARPVIATAIGGTDEAVVDGETGLLVPPDDPVRLAAAMRVLIDNPSLGPCLGVRGRARIEAHFASASMIEQVAAVYDAVLS